MLRLIYSFSRRIRARADIKIEPRLQHYENQYEIEKQGGKLRLLYNKSTSEADFEPFSQILKGQKPKLQEQKTFKLDKVDLRKKMKEMYFSSIDNVEKEHTAHIRQHRDFLEDKSHLHDQQEEIEFEKKFKKELFEKKETKLRVRKEVETPEYYLTQSMNHEVIEYLQAKKDIKNIKTEHMLGAGKNNRFLEKILESGLLDDTAKFKKVMEAYQRRKDNNGEQEQEVKRLTHHSDSSEIQPINGEDLEIIEYSEVLDGIKSQTEQERNKISKTLNLMQKVKDFEEKQFLKRYDAINFRFKGVVDFDCYTEPQLLSYIKHQTTEPKQLLEIFAQNIGRMNRDNTNLIMTPAVLGQLYTKTTTFRFPQTTENNRTNMLADRHYAKLEYMIFTNLDKLGDRALTDVIYSFAKNHSEEQGALRPRQFDRILEAIVRQFGDRVGSLDEMLLGGICRSLTNLPTVPNTKETELMLRRIKDRIEGIKDLYALESICMFCSVVDSSLSKEIIGLSINTFMESSDWNLYTLVNTAKFFSSLLLGPQASVYKPRLLELYREMSHQLPEIIPEININNLQAISVFFLKLGFYDKTVWNSIKKSVTESLKQQKYQLNISTVPTLMSTFAFFDYNYKHLPKDIEQHSLISQFLVRRSLRHNSSKFDVYHEAAKFLSDEGNRTSTKGKLMILRALAFIGYPNKPFFDTYINQCMMAAVKGNGNISVLMQLVNCHSLLRRVNSMTDYMVEKIKACDIAEQDIRVEVLISYLSSLGNLYEGTQDLNLHVEEVFNKIFDFLWDIKNSHRISLLSSLIQLGLGNSLMAYEVLGSIEPKEDMEQNEKYLLSVCLQFLPNSHEKWTNIKQSFKTLELSYYKKTRQDILQNEFSLGCVFSFQKFQEDFVRKEQNQNRFVISLPWRVEIVEKQPSEVCFFYTYDMLASRENDQGQITMLFPTGVWKLLVKMYEEKGWRVEVLRTFEFKSAL